MDGRALIEAVALSKPAAEVHRRLGLKAAGGTKTGIDRHIARLRLDTTHFRGQGWSKGTAKRPEEFEADIRPLLRKGPRIGHLRDRLIKAELKRAQCEECGITEWCGQPAPLQVDHIDGDWMNNELDNLRILCANCHMLTETRGHKNGRRRPVQALVAELR
ncbi:HNH endonuclease [Nonomuraea sp. NPDC050451]|uniref:HNH endonuclease n=1 Tax=Nonomuraea sp. NPDC050451 TaxID=3364364 RepID=UPI0037A748D7